MPEPRAEAEREAMERLRAGIETMFGWATAPPLLADLALVAQALAEREGRNTALEQWIEQWAFHPDSCAITEHRRHAPYNDKKPKPPCDCGLAALLPLEAPDGK